MLACTIQAFFLLLFGTTTEKEIPYLGERETVTRPVPPTAGEGPVLDHCGAVRHPTLLVVRALAGGIEPAPGRPFGFEQKVVTTFKHLKGIMRVNTTQKWVPQALMTG